MRSVEMTSRKNIIRFFAIALLVFLGVNGFSIIIKVDPDGKQDRVRSEKELEKELSFNKVIPQIGNVETSIRTANTLLQKDVLDNEPIVTSLPSGGKRTIDDEQALKAADETSNTSGKQSWWRSFFFGVLFTCLGLGAWVGFKVWVEKNYRPPTFKTKSKKEIPSKKKRR